MKLTIGIIASLLLVITTNCTSTESKSEQVIEQAVEHVENSHDLKLDGENKWLVDPEMMVAIRKMETEINNFEGDLMDEFKNHAETISELIGDLTSNCTMKGEAHDELHKWLLPFIDLNDELIKSNSNDKSSELVTKQKEEIKLFNTYFK
ncbi:MAG: hypothetical protein IT221_14045 [Fluviicola sp.]|nr:hypothetical protein [Fluviicola sp.]